MKNISILGSTGSIGTQTLDTIRQFPSEFKVVGLSANNNSELLLKQIKEFKPKAVAIMDKTKADDLLNFSSCQVFCEKDGLKKIAALQEAEIIVNALVGSVGIGPTYEAIKKKKAVALSNKETLVAAGDIIINEARKNNSVIIPIDSEHSAIFQCMQGNEKNAAENLILTCSGGPFRDKTREEMQKARMQDALNHPNWNMGKKITIDCATLMNKGLEVIEAHHLFAMDYNKIKVLIHKDSIMHSMVEFCDKSVIAQLGFPDMKIPIQYALSYPKRLKNNLPSLDLARIKSLTFAEPDIGKFPCLNYAYDAGKIGGTMPAALNAANEIAVGAFLGGKLGFMDIARIVKHGMDNHNPMKNPAMDDILDADSNTRKKTIEFIQSEISG